MHQQLLKEIELGSKNALIKKKFVKYYIYNGSATITDLSKELGLSVPTVTKFISEMCEEGYINDYGKLETSGGRHPSLYGLNPASGYFVGVDIKKFSVNIGIINFKGDMVEQKMGIPYRFENTPEALEELCRLISKFISKTSIDTGKILNININISGRVNPESDKQNFNFSKTDLIPHCQNVMNSIQTSINKDTKLYFRHSTLTANAETDLTKFNQILINLIGNAAKFTREGFIELSVKPDDEAQEWVFSVTDTGCGIPLDKQKAVFERFYKLDEYVQGTGLGLSICKITIKKLGGRIWIDSEYMQGARFIFTIPYKHKRDVTTTPLIIE